MRNTDFSLLETVCSWIRDFNVDQYQNRTTLFLFDLLYYTIKRDMLGNMRKYVKSLYLRYFPGFFDFELL